MATRDMPWSKWFWSDWSNDPNLRRCSKAAKGFWMDCLALMYECEDRGALATGGEPWSDDDIAAAIGGDPAENLSCLQELAVKGVISRNESGSIYSRRMVRDEQVRRERSKAGSKGGSKTQAKRQAKLKQVLSVSDSDSCIESSGGSAEGGDDPPEDIPPPLDTPEFHTSWEQWHAYRREAKLRRWIGSTRKKQLKKLAKLGERHAIDAIEHSITNGYQGIFPSGGSGPGSPGKTPQARAETRRADQRAKEHPDDSELTF